MAREILLREMPGGRCECKINGNPTEMWALVQSAMAHNRVVAAIFMQAVLEYCDAERIDLSQLRAKARRSGIITPPFQG